MRWLDMSVADREGLADLLSIVCVLLWLLLSNSTLKLPIVFKVLLLLLLALLIIVVSLFTHKFMVLMAFAMAVCWISMLKISAESGPMKQVFLHIQIRVKVRTFTGFATELRKRG